MSIPFIATTKDTRTKVQRWESTNPPAAGASRVQQKIASSATAIHSLTLTLDATPTAGNILVCLIADGGDNGYNSPSGGGGLWEEVNPGWGSGHGASGIWVCTNATSAGPITVQNSSAAANLTNVVVEEWSGLSTATRGHAYSSGAGSHTLNVPGARAGDVAFVVAGIAPSLGGADSISSSTPVFPVTSSAGGGLVAEATIRGNSTVTATVVIPASNFYATTELAVFIPTPPVVTDPLTSISGLVGWWKADAITGLTDGAAVSSWLDSSGATGAATQATGGSQPIYKTNVQNGHPVVRFAGGQSLVAAGSTVHAQPVTIFQVVKLTTTSDQIPYDGADGTNRLATWLSSGVRTLYAGLNVASESPTVAWPTGFAVQASTFNAASTTSRWLGNVTQPLASSPSTNSYKGITIGSIQGGSAYFITGDVAEILVYSRALTESETAQVEEYLQTKWFPPPGVTDALAGTARGVAAVAGTLVLALALSGTAAGHATSTGTLHETLALTGTSSAAATCTGNLSVALAGGLTGTAAGQSTATGSLALAHPLSGTAAGYGTATGTVTLRLGFSGSAAGHATSSGNLSVPVFTHLAGTARGAGSAVGQAGYQRFLAGTATGVGSASGDLGYRLVQPLAGTASGAGAAGGGFNTIAPPDNDPFSSPTILTGSSGTSPIVTIGDSYEYSSLGYLQEPDPAIGVGSVWYLYTPAADGTLFVGTGQTPAPAWQTRVDVYSGTMFSDLVPEATGDLGTDPQPSITDSLTGGTSLMVVAGTAYHIRVQDNSDTDNQRSDGVLNWTYAPITYNNPFASITLGSSAVSVYSLQLNATNLNPGQVLTFNLVNQTTSVDLGALPDTVIADDSGVVSAASISIIPTGASSPPPADNYYLVVHAGSDTSLPFTLSLLEGDVPQPLPTAPSVFTPTGVVRWVFEDVTPGVGIPTWTVPLNPETMTSPYGDKNITDQGTVSSHGQSLLFEGMPKPVNWEFTGWVLDETHYANLAYWYGLKYRIYIHDHYGRAWEVYITGLDVKPVRATNKPWRHQYTMKTIITRGPITP